MRSALSRVTLLRGLPRSLLRRDRAVGGLSPFARASGRLAGWLLLFDGGFRIYRRVHGPLAELPRELQAVVRLDLELLSVIDTVDRADLDAQAAVHAARVVYDEADRVWLCLARAVGVALGLLDGDTVVRADAHAL